MRLFRFFRILFTIVRFGLDEFLFGHERVRGLRIAFLVLFFWRPLVWAQDEPRAVRLRKALESLGPIFVKFGQLLSTRRDLVPLDLADELARLQDSVPPFPSAQVEAVLERAYGVPYREIFSEFDLTPVASASVAQVHFAVIGSGKQAGREAAVKILRPGVADTIDRDIAVLDVVATLVEWFFEDGPRLRPHEVVAEFGKTTHDELDLIREASSASQLRRNFAPGTLLYVPEVYWDYCRREVMVMERIDAIAVNDVATLEAHGISLERLARQGVEIFFTQVFRDGFFHADMHPGNIFVRRDGVYSGVDFGIMGTLSDADKAYLAQNFMAFFKRDYRRIAMAHIDAGWVPADTRVEEFESAVRAVCEPIFDRPLDEIYFGTVLLRLFEVSRRFRMQIQPQLLQLQKTLLQVEGLGRQLYPQLDLRPVAQPILQRWMDEQIGLRGLVRQIREEAPLWARTLPQLPRLLHRALYDDGPRRLEQAVDRLVAVQRKQTRVLGAVAVAVGFMVLVLGYLYLLLFWNR